MTGIDFLAVVEKGTQRFAEVLDDADLGAPVPTCPDWTLFDLAEHVGGVHQWATHAIVAGNPDGQPTSAPKGRAELAAWYRESAATLLNALRETPEDAPAWHFGAKPRRAGWWRRRQAHEISVHLWDAENALGSAPVLDAVLSADGIDEVRHVFFPRQVRLGRMPALERSLAVVVQETGARYVFAGDGTGTGETADATVNAPAEVLLLALWHRIPVDDSRLAISGDAVAAHAVLGAAVTA